MVPSVQSRVYTRIWTVSTGFFPGNDSRAGSRNRDGAGYSRRTGKRIAGISPDRSTLGSSRPSYHRPQYYPPPTPALWPGILGRNLSPAHVCRDPKFVGIIIKVTGREGFSLSEASFEDPEIPLGIRFDAEVDDGNVAVYDVTAYFQFPGIHARPRSTGSSSNVWPDGYG